MAEIAVSLAIQNLVPLLERDATFLEGIHYEVGNMKREMEMIQSFLMDADTRVENDDMSNGLKTWVKWVREEAFNIEDVIDKYILPFLEQRHRQRKCLYFLQKIFHITTNLKAQHVMASKIQSINKILKHITERSATYLFNATISDDRRHDPLISSLFFEKIEHEGNEYHRSLFVDESELVGIESHRDKLINLLIEGTSDSMVISVVGIGGCGKTILVKKVYDNDKVLAHFNCHAWINVSRSYNMDELLRSMIKQFYVARKKQTPREIDTMATAQLIEMSRAYLLEQRYIVIFDDIWDAKIYETIKLALPNNNRGNRIIITTRDESVAPSRSPDYYHVYKLPPLPFEKALELFYKKAFQQEEGKCPPELLGISHEIVKRCGGLPLAIVSIGRFFSTKARVVSEWSEFLNNLSPELENNPFFRINKLLSLSYHDLSYNLKACFLYFGMFPEVCAINCARLTRLWIAEGFVKAMMGLTLEDVARGYLNLLIHKGLVQVVKVDFFGRARSCQVHSMMRGVILSRSEHLGFRLVSIQKFSSFDGSSRRISIQNIESTSLQSNTSSQTRSIVASRVDEVPNYFFTTCSKNFKLMKIMDFEGCSINYIPEEVGNLFHLKYLSLRDTKVQMLPKSIGKLHNLETLDLKRSFVFELPMEISDLHKLRYLAAYIENDDVEHYINFRRAVKLPKGIGCLESLQMLHKVEANNNALIEELGRLRQLRKLHISTLKRENGITLCNALEKMSHLRSLRISAISAEEILELQSLSSPPPLLQTLNLGGRLEMLPGWIPELKYIVRIGLTWSRLMDDPLKVLQDLPNLMTLGLYDGYGGEQLHIKGGGFQKLKVLGLRNLRGLNRLIIDEGALLLLETLRIGPCQLLNDVPSGIQHLKSLTSLQFFAMPREFVLSLQPDGPNFWKVKHISSVLFLIIVGAYSKLIHRENYKAYNLGDPELLERLRS